MEHSIARIQRDSFDTRSTVSNVSPRESTRYLEPDFRSIPRWSELTTGPSTQSLCTPIAVQHPNIRYEHRRVREEQFFQVGRVFDTLWSEVSSTIPSDGMICTTVPGGRIYTRNRRFIVIRRGYHSCTCLPISTYSTHQISGMNLREHGEIHNSRTLPGIEAPGGKSIALCLSPGAQLPISSFVDYGRVYTVELGVAVEEVGLIRPSDKRTLLQNFQQIFVSGIDFKKLEPNSNLNNINPASTKSIESKRNGLAAIPQSFQPTKRWEKGEILDPRYQVISEPTRFFKIGRVFKTLWIEPSARNINDSKATVSKFGESSYATIRRFVVLREKRGQAICLAIFTYGSKGTLKAGVNPLDHAIVYGSQEKPQLLDGEKQLQKQPFPIVIEDPQETIVASSRLDFGRTFSVEHNIKVCKIGRIATEHLPRLDEYFEQTIVETSKYSKQRKIDRELAIAAASSEIHELQVKVEHFASENKVLRNTLIHQFELFDTCFRKNGVPVIVGSPKSVTKRCQCQCASCNENKKFKIQEYLHHCGQNDCYLSELLKNGSFTTKEQLSDRHVVGEDRYLVGDGKHINKISGDASKSVHSPTAEERTPQGLLREAVSALAPWRDNVSTLVARASQLSLHSKTEKRGSSMNDTCTPPSSITEVSNGDERALKYEHVPENPLYLLGTQFDTQRVHHRLSDLQSVLQEFDNEF